MAEDMLFLDRATVLRCAAEIDIVEEISAVLRDHCAHRVSMPAEGALYWNNSAGAPCRSLALLGGLSRDSGDLYGLKVINAAMDNPGRGMERAGGVTLLFDPETARPRCMAEAGYLSAARTSAYSILSIDLLGPPTWDSASFVGAGTQAAMHIDMMVERFPALGTVYLFDLDRARTEAVAAATREKHARLRVVVSPSARDAVGAAPVIITVTTSTTPYIPADWIAAGSFVAHVSLDDLTPGALLGAQALYVDDVELIRENPQRILGHLLNEEPATHVTGTLGAVLDGTCSVVRPCAGYVVSNPFGMSILDVGLAAAVERRARELGLGHVLELR
jgi:ornithine cyclodeaminase/alanine dehydrogenase-like protein (mu-crystallin family)